MIVRAAAAAGVGSAFAASGGGYAGLVVFGLGTRREPRHRTSRSVIEEGLHCQQQKISTLELISHHQQLWDKKISGEFSTGPIGFYD